MDIARPLKTISINADLGEGCGHDAALYPLLDYANIACGGHAGNAHSIQCALELSLAHGVVAGAHPSYPDIEGFGRRKPAGPIHALYDTLSRQIELFENLAARFGAKTVHFKAHGQLYNDAAFDPAVGQVIVQLARTFPHLTPMVLAQSALVQWCQDAGVAVLQEAFPDRAYLPSAELVPRAQANALIDDEFHLRSQAMAMASWAPFACASGEALTLQADTLCVHGDSEQALRNCKVVRDVVNARNRGVFQVSQQKSPGAH